MPFNNVKNFKTFSKLKLSTGSIGSIESIGRIESRIKVIGSGNWHIPAVPMAGPYVTRGCLEGTRWYRGYSSKSNHDLNSDINLTSKDGYRGYRSDNGNNSFVIPVSIGIIFIGLMQLFKASYDIMTLRLTLTDVDI